MTSIATKARVGPDGNITIPIGQESAGLEVLVTVTPAKPPLTVDEWKALVDQTRGSIDDPTFVRHPPGHFEPRDVLE